MTWIDFLWPMVTGACVTMGVIHLRTGLRRRPGTAHLLFALNAFVVAVYSVLEHALTRSDSPARYLAVLRWMDIVGGGPSSLPCPPLCGYFLAPAESGSLGWHRA